MEKENLFVDGCTERRTLAMSQTPTSEKGIRWGTGGADGQLNVPAKAASGESPPDPETRGGFYSCFWKKAPGFSGQSRK